MSDEMMTKIQEAIRANIPAQVGAELQKLLADGEQAKKDVAKAINELRERNERIDSLSKQLAAHAVITEREAAAKKREDAVLLREQKAELNEYKVVAADQRAKDCKEMVGIVFANSRFKYQAYESINEDIPHPRADQGYGPTMHLNKSKTSTIETEGDNPKPPGA